MPDAALPKIEPIPVRAGTWSEIPERTPTAAHVEGVDLVIIRRGGASRWTTPWPERWPSTGPRWSRS